jgi:hypothetical protein
VIAMPKLPRSHGHRAGIIQVSLVNASCLSPWRLSLGVLGIVVATAFFMWLLVGWVGWMPTMVDVFGVEGLRTPAAITVAALLTAAIAFRDC